MKSRLFLTLITLTFFVTVSAQEELKVKSLLPSVNDLTARTQIRKDNGGEPCALVKVVLADNNVSFECGNLASMIIGDVTFHTNEYWIYLVAGTGGAKHLKVKHPNYPTIDVVFSDFGFSTLEPQTTYTLVISKPRKESKFKRTGIYVAPTGHFGMLNAIGATVGGYIKNFNVEAYYLYGLSSSEEIYWISSVNTGENNSYSYTYSPSMFGANIGYGILLGERFRLTPQIGAGVVAITGKEKSIGDNNPNAVNGYAVDMSFAIKAEFYVAKHFSIGIAPAYNIAVSKSDLFTRVSDISSKVKNFGSGFNAKIVLSLNL